MNPEPPCWHVYVLRNPDGKLYIGQTDDLSRRIQQHNDPLHTLTRTTNGFAALGTWSTRKSSIRATQLSFEKKR